MELDDLKVDFNAVLTSGGGSLTDKQFMSDFRSLIGKNIPYRQFGHNDLLSLLKSLGYHTSKRGADTIIYAQGDEKTAHIASLIARQKKKPGKPKVRKSYFPSSYSRRPSKPPPLLDVRRRSLVAPVAYRGGTPRQPPPPRFGNPPIIPQRQPLSTTAQSRLDSTKKDVPDVSSVNRINVIESRKTILNDESDNCSRPNENSNSKGPHFVEEAVDEANFVDIQWLQAKVKPNRTVVATQNTSIPDNATLSVDTAFDNSSPSPSPKSPQHAKSPSRPSGPEQTVSFTCHVEELSMLAARLDLPAPLFTEIKRKPSKGPALYLCKVKLGDGITFNSFPDEKGTPEEAKELVAKLACADLNLRLIKLNVQEPITDIIKEKKNGIFDHAVVSAYETKFNSAIVASWLDIITRSPKFIIEKVNQNTIIYPQELPSVPVTLTPASGPTTEPKCNGGVSSANHTLCKDINANTVIVTESKPRTLPDLVLPNTNTWDVFVTSVGTDDIWVRLIGDDYDAKYNDVMTDLELKMVAYGEIVSNPQINDYYCIKCDSCFIRVQLKEIISEEECEVFLVDNGETDTISLSDLRVLPVEYTTLPAQAIQCRLSYLDISYEAAQTYLMNYVIGSSFVAEVVKLPCPNQTNLANIILHNTNSEDEKKGPINVNYCILEEIVKKLEPPSVTQRHVAFLRLTHVEAGCSPYCQVEGKDLEFLETILKEIHENMDMIYLHGLNAHPRMGTKSQTKQYLCKFKNTWRRGTILSTDDSRNPTVYFIDYGQKEKVMLRDIFDLEKVYPPLINFPPQAIQVNLLNLPPSKLNVGVIHRLKELAPPNTSVISKCVNVVGGVPEVELFKRLQPLNIIASLNVDLTFNYEEYSLRTEPEEPSSFPLRGAPGCTNPLDKYPLPSVNSGFFDVSVSMSSAPSNFVVQPLQNRLAFDKMAEEMQELYEAQYSVMPSPAIEELTENATFAAKHPEDLMWYRVSIVTATDSTVSVRYLDWGDVGLVPIEDLRYLEPRFRTIPALAIRAKLHGVKPKENTEWTVDQCLYFNELVDSKSFVSKVMDVNSESNSLSWQLSLHLIDTTAEDMDVNISELLVSAGFADVVHQ
ncbi:tudor domain-containing protein 7 [Thrips palmi]|uniref:Tudor domain-containing protein 7 n=1 Tax=Thrips palmi TaxID=161013 RepID=A0A6P9A7I0_THRPL|nr:tudor domain-containing protein 7 [Thrips palmi]